ncbi:antA/AntB antirepressor family protein [Haemophilus influenzae]|uniref:antA/AntB antirepressor family protein n=1 Tax=Haemophilus influenzae TaxID=727 RepID=UPI000E5678FB|nr:antA/AntB antirepressor family protein [Haemophilus influenzae]MCK9002435.1 antA/AntB antirepressor family protein [Haemophilus influenzae]
MTHLNLIPVFNGLIQNQPVQLCNARELHAFVKSKQEYATWIKNRINEYGFIQDEDYLVITECTNGRPHKEYHITLDMGKELGMVERNERGRQIRQYFIRCERTLKALQQPQHLALPEPEKKFSFEFTEYELEQLIWLWCGHKQMNTLIGDMIKPLETIGSYFIGMVISHHQEYRRQYKNTLPTIQKLIVPFKASNQMNWERAKNLIAQ